jgi:benzodiazapine receptor
MAQSAWDAKLNFREILFWQIFLIIIALALIASFFTNTGLYSPWYNNLPQAPWYPPSWLFVLAWTFLYLLIAFTGYIGVRLDPYRYGFLALLSIGILVNVLWCLAFFTLESVEWGFGLIILLDVIVLAQVLYLLILGARLKSKAMIASGALLVLYLAWGIYATTLNGFILFPSEA